MILNRPYAERGIRLCRVLTTTAPSSAAARATNADSISVEDIARAVLDECYRLAFRKTVYRTKRSRILTDKEPPSFAHRHPRCAPRPRIS